MEQLDQYGRKIKKGTVFGFLCKGRGEDGRLVYRFGKTTKGALDERYRESDQKIVAIERLGMCGLNRPERVVLWENVSDVNDAWDICERILRGLTQLEHEPGFGDKYYSAVESAAFADLFAALRE